MRAAIVLFSVLTLAAPPAAHHAGVSANLLSAGAAMILLGVMAAGWPGWKAARLDPAVVLRSE